MDPTNWVRYMLEVEYPLIDDYTGDHAEVVELFHRRLGPVPRSGFSPGFPRTETQN